MKLIIDIPEELYRTLQEALKNHMESLIGKIILNSTPIPDNATVCDIEQIRAEIADLDDADYDYEGYYKAVTDAVNIIDKYTKGE